MLCVWKLYNVDTKYWKKRGSKTLLLIGATSICKGVRWIYDGDGLIDTGDGFTIKSEGLNYNEDDLIIMVTDTGDGLIHNG